MKFFSDIKPIIKAQGGTQLASTTNDTLDNIKSTDTTQSDTESTTNTAVEEPKVKIYQAPDGVTWTNSIDNPNEAELLSKGWTLVNSMPRREYDALGMGGYDAKDKFKGTTSFDVKGDLGETKTNPDKKGLTFSDLRALNATTANKIERVPQSMPVSQMTRVDPLGRSQAIDKQKQDAQANANAARMKGPQNADPTLNVLQNLGITEQTNKATQQANMMQGENLSNQRDRQRQQVDIANQVEVQNQNVRIGLRNAQEREMAQKKTQQRVTNAQIGNTWLGEKEGEQKAGIFADTQLVDRYAQLGMQQDPDYIANKAEAATLIPQHFKAKSDYTESSTRLLLLEDQLEKNPTDTLLKEEVDKQRALTTQLQTTYSELDTKHKALTERQQALINKYEKALIDYQRDVNRNSNQVGGAKTENSFNKILGPLLNPKTPIKKKGGSMTMADKLYLEDVRQRNKIELQRNKEMTKSFVLPEPKAYFLSMQMMVAQNKAVTDMVKDIYKTIYGGNKKR